MCLPMPFRCGRLGLTAPLLFSFPTSQETHLDQILLNGNNIAVLVPGGKPDDM